MGIEYVSVEAEDALCCPIIICDFCDKQLTKGGVVFRMENTRDPINLRSSPLHFTHRGTCYQIVSEILEGHYGEPGSGWMELSDNLEAFMAQMAYNFSNQLMEPYARFKLT